MIAYKSKLAAHILGPTRGRFLFGSLPGNSVLIWGGYGWRDLNHGPPGCDKSDGDHCTPEAVPWAQGNAEIADPL